MLKRLLIALGLTQQERTFEDKVLILLSRLNEDHQTMVVQLIVQLNRLETGETT